MAYADLVKELRDRLIETQKLDVESAQQSASHIASADDDIVEAAREWAHSGRMPKLPTVMGYTPASLDADFFPSQTFGILMGLRADPEGTIRSIKRLPGRRTGGPGPTGAPKLYGEDPVLESVFARIAQLAEQVRGLHDEAIAGNADPNLSAHIEEHAMELAKLRDQLHGVRLIPEDLSERHRQQRA
ncbi:MAG: hypothetical protein ACREP9_23710 [Candidatus Dormibacteraceae bacterium]